MSGQGDGSIGQRIDVLDRRPTSAVGRQARLELVFAVRGGRTVLAHAYAEPPFRVGRWFPEGGSAHMILAWSAPGIFGGDDLEQSIRVEEGAHVRLTSQSALQAHPSRGASAARLRGTYDVGQGGRLDCEWDPLIPFPGARFVQQIEVRLSRGAHLYWSDAFMSGREGRGERWKFSLLAHELRLSRDGSLDYLERYHLEPGRASPAHRWTAASASYFGTILQSGLALDEDTRQSLHRHLGLQPHLTGGVDAIERGLTLVRLMAEHAVPFHASRAHVRRTFCACDSEGSGRAR